MHMHTRTLVYMCIKTYALHTCRQIGVHTYIQQQRQSTHSACIKMHALAQKLLNRGCYTHMHACMYTPTHIYTHATHKHIRRAHTSMHTYTQARTQTLAHKHPQGAYTHACTHRHTRTCMVSTHMYTRTLHRLLAQVNPRVGFLPKYKSRKPPRSRHRTWWGHPWVQAGNRFLVPAVVGRLLALLHGRGLSKFKCKPSSESFRRPQEPARAELGSGHCGRKGTPQPIAHLLGENLERPSGAASRWRCVHAHLQEPEAGRRARSPAQPSPGAGYLWRCA